METYLNPHLGEANDFIAQHIKLVHHMAKKFGNLIKGSFGYDDVISAGTMGLWKAYKTFDPSNGAKWATYASRCIENEFLMAFRRQRKDRQTINLEAVLSTDVEGNQLTLADLLPAPPDDQTGADVDSFIQSLSESDRRILLMRMDGERQRDIANERKQSQSYTSRRLKEIGRKYLEGRWRNVIQMTKEQYLAERASGKKRTDINKELGVNPNTFYIQLAKWGIKEFDAEQRALEMFDTKSAKADKPSPEIVEELKKAVEEAAPTAVTLVVPPTIDKDIDSKPSSEAVEPFKEREPSISNPYYVEPETKSESVQYVTVRIPVRRVSKPDERYKIDRGYTLNMGVEYLQSVTMNIWDELTDILGPGDYTQQVQQFIERKLSNVEVAG